LERAGRGLRRGMWVPKTGVVGGGRGEGMAEGWKRGADGDQVEIEDEKKAWSLFDDDGKRSFAWADDDDDARTERASFDGAEKAMSEKELL
jgi:hypothetical protein